MKGFRGLRVRIVRVVGSVSRALGFTGLGFRGFGFRVIGFIGLN